MTGPRPPRSRSRVMLHVAAGGTLAAALVLLLAPIRFASVWHAPRSVLLVFEALRLVLPLGAVYYLRRRLPIAGESESGAARTTGWAGLCIAAAGILWMSHDVEREMTWVVPGLLDLPWYGLLVMNESARLGVQSGSRALGLLALVGLGLALTLTLTLGSFVSVNRAASTQFMYALGELYELVAPRPWVVMLWLAGLWAWIAAQDRPQPSLHTPTASRPESAGTT